MLDIKTIQLTGFNDVSGAIKLIGLNKGRVSSRETACLLKKSRDFQMLFAAVAHSQFSSLLFTC
jgi:hypothetical protein